MITDKIKVLIVEDNLNDAKLIEYHIKKIIEKPEIISVDTFDDFAMNLLSFSPDIILSDYKMNGFTGMEVLKHTKQNSLVSNFIFITGTIYDEELAAETILSGATGYILKKHMNRLNEKLLPYFNKIVNSKKITILPKGHKRVFESMREYIETAERENEANLEAYNQIKEALDQFKMEQKQNKNKN